MKTKSLYLLCASIALATCAMAQAADLGSSAPGLQTSATKSAQGPHVLMSSTTLPPSVPGGGQQPGTIQEAQNSALFLSAKNNSEGEAGSATAKMLGHAAFNGQIMTAKLGATLLSAPNGTVQPN